MKQAHINSQVRLPLALHNTRQNEPETWNMPRRLTTSLPQSPEQWLHRLLVSVKDPIPIMAGSSPHSDIVNACVFSECRLATVHWKIPLLVRNQSYQGCWELCSWISSHDDCWHCIVKLDYQLSLQSSISTHCLHQSIYVDCLLVDLSTTHRPLHRSIYRNCLFTLLYLKRRFLTFLLIVAPFYYVRVHI